MDNIIFEDPSKRVSRKNQAGSTVALPVAGCDMATKQASEPIDPYFRHDSNFDVHPYGKEPVSLYDIFSLSGDEDLINGSPEVSSAGNIDGLQEWSVPVTCDPTEDVFPIDPAILGKESEDESVALDCSSSSYPTSPKSLAPHRHTQIVEDSAPVSDANSDTQRSPSKRQRSDEINCDTPRKPCRSDSLTAKDRRCTLCTLYSCFSAAPLHERLGFLAWLWKTGLSESLSAASIELPPTQVKTADPCIEPTRSKHHRPRAARNRAGPTSTKSRKGKAWEHEEIRFLVQLKKERSPWSVIEKSFKERFPGRTLATIRVYWSKHYKNLLD